MSDFKQAFRQLILRPALSLTVIAMLALGIGATTAVFSLFHEILLRPLPVPEPERLVNLGAPGPHLGSTSCSMAGDCEHIFSYPMFRDLQAEQTVFTGIAGHRDFVTHLAYDGRTETGSGLLVSGSYFRVLGLTPAIGRLIDDGDEPAIGEAAVAVLSYDFWKSRFGLDASVLGRGLTINGQRLTVIGVAPAGFSGTIEGLRAQVFVPITLRWLMEPTRAADQDKRFSYWVYLFARLKRGATFETAAAAIRTLYGRIIDEVEAPQLGSVDDEAVTRFRSKQITVEPGAHGQSQVFAGAAPPLTLLLGITALLLLIVCVNIANLLLARGVSRASELAIRASLGASRRRLVAQLLAEGGLLAAIAAVVCLPLAALTLRVVTGLLPAELTSGLQVWLSGPAMLFGGGVSLATLALFGLFPAIRASRADRGSPMNGRTRAMGSRDVVRFRDLLATVEIALSLVLLVLAGLFTRSLMNVARVDLGMDVDSLVTFTVSPRASGYRPERTMRVLDRIEADLAAEPGVTHVASARIALLTGRRWGTRVSFDGSDVLGADRADRSSLTNEVSPGFFRTLSIPLLSGRDFADSDTLGSPRVAIINERFLHKFGLGGDAVGKRFQVGPLRDVEIVGIVADAKYADVTDEIPAQVFLARRQEHDLDALSYYVRGGDTDSLMRAIRSAMSDVDANLPIGKLTTMRRQVRDDVYLNRLVTVLSASFAALATLLAAIGLYGVLAYSVGQRSRELGLRLALGAEPGRLRGMVLRRVCAMVLAGGIVGIAAALVLGRIAESLLYEVAAYDPTVLVAAVAVLAVVALAAAYLPARRASNIAPMEALRHE